jgi:hypothetical protein
MDLVAKKTSWRSKQAAGKVTFRTAFKIYCQTAVYSNKPFWLKV